MEGRRESGCEKEGGKETNEGRCESRYGGKEFFHSNEPSASKVSFVGQKNPAPERTFALGAWQRCTGQRRYSG